MKKERRKILILDLGLLLSAALAWPLSKLMVYLPSCPFPAMGFQCPACGGTRFVRYLLQLRITDAFFVNPYFFLLCCYVGVSLALLNIGVLAEQGTLTRLARRLLGWKFVIVAAIAFGIFGVVRNFV